MSGASPTIPKNKWLISTNTSGSRRSNSIVVPVCEAISISRLLIETFEVLSKTIGLFFAVKVNGTEVGKKDLSPGDQILVGKSEFRYEV